MIRVLLARMPVMLSELVGSLVSAETGIQLVMPRPGEPPLRTARREAVDVLIIQLASLGGEDACLIDLTDDRALSIIAISEDGRLGRHWRLQPTHIAFESVPNGLVRALRVVTNSDGMME